MTTFTDKVLEEIPSRAAKLIDGIGAVAPIRTMMAEVGVDDEDIEEGSGLLIAVFAAKARRPVTDTDGAKAQRSAVAELDQWDEPHFAICEATLARRFPEQRDYVFGDDLKPSTGIQAVTGVATFLSRLDALDKGTEPGREGSRKQDKEAVDVLSKKRGLTKKERARLHDLVDVALGPTAALPDQTPEAEGAWRDKRIALKRWYDEMAAAAKAKIKKRSYLIRLGLASRKPPSKKGEKKDEPQ